MRQFFYEYYQSFRSVKFLAAFALVLVLSLVTTRTDSSYTPRDVEFSIRMVGEKIALQEFCSNTGLDPDEVTLEEAVAEQYRQQSYRVFFSLAGCIPLIGGFLLVTAIVGRDFYRRRFHFAVRGGSGHWRIWAAKTGFYYLLVILLCSLWSVFMLFRYARPVWAELDHSILWRNFFWLILVNVTAASFQMMVGFLLRHPIPIAAVLYFLPIMWTNVHNKVEFDVLDPFYLATARADLFLPDVDLQNLQTAAIACIGYFVACSLISWLSFSKRELL